MKDSSKSSRRDFIKKNTLLGAGAAVGLGSADTIFASCSSETSTPAILGGTPIAANRMDGLNGRYGIRKQTNRDCWKLCAAVCGPGLKWFLNLKRNSVI